jgi:hypothetical protein
MQNHYRAFLVAVTFIFLMLNGCATRIGNQSRFEETVFEIGKTTKHEVADTLGLPAKIKKNEASGDELWAYQQKPTLISIDVAAVDWQRPRLVYPIGFSPNNIFVNDFKNTAVVYGFNNNGILVDVKYNEQNKNNKD